MQAYQEKKDGAKKGKKRGRASTSDENGTNGTVTKRGRKSHPSSGSPPASVKKAEFKPPSGSWEHEVVAIDACEGQNDSAVVVYLTWRGGQKTQHPLQQVYKRCPQKMLSFYESHLYVSRTFRA